MGLSSLNEIKSVMVTLKKDEDLYLKLEELYSTLFIWRDGTKYNLKMKAISKSYKRLVAAEIQINRETLLAVSTIKRRFYQLLDGIVKFQKIFIKS